MRRRSGWLFVALLVLALAWGIGSVYRLRVARGDVFPEYSSLRADPLGTRALHDAAQRLPGRSVERWMRPLSRLEAGAGQVLFVTGVPRDLGSEEWAALDRAAIAGAAVVVAWRAESSEPGDASIAREMRTAPWEEPKPEPDSSKKKKSDAKTKAKADAGEDEDEADAERARLVNPPPRHASAHERRWGYRLARRELVTRDGDPDARRAEGASGAWPAALANWRSDLFFLPRPADDWRALYRRGGDIVMMSRNRGAGRITLFADSFALSNEAVHRDRATAVLADLFGDARRVVFVESHLGVEMEVGVAVLARRYGLGGAVVLALVLAALWFWRRASPLAPVPPEETELRLAIAPTAGLEALLRRAISPAKLHEACVAAWRGTASVSDRRRLDAMDVPASADPVAAHRAVSRALSKRTLS